MILEEEEDDGQGESSGMRFDKHFGIYSSPSHYLSSGRSHSLKILSSFLLSPFILSLTARVESGSKTTRET